VRSRLGTKRRFQRHIRAVTWVPAGSSRRFIRLRLLRGLAMGETRRKFDWDFREGAVPLVRETGKPRSRPAAWCAKTAPHDSQLGL
jgi:hypothetical protein